MFPGKPEWVVGVNQGSDEDWTLLGIGEKAIDEAEKRKQSGFTLYGTYADSLLVINGDAAALIDMVTGEVREINRSE